VELALHPVHRLTVPKSGAAAHPSRDRPAYQSPDVRPAGETRTACKPTIPAPISRIVGQSPITSHQEKPTPCPSSPSNRRSPRRGTSTPPFRPPPTPTPSRSTGAP